MAGILIDLSRREDDMLLLFSSANHRHRFAFAGMEKPRVMKSVRFSSIVPLVENKLLTLSFAPSLRLLLRASCSASTFAVKEAVSAFLILLSGLGVAGLGFDMFSDGSSSATSVFFKLACFFLFLPLPVAFFKECVKP